MTRLYSVLVEGTTMFGLVRRRCVCDTRDHDVAHVILARYTYVGPVYSTYSQASLCQIY